ncbi:hypothetical protein PVAND_009455 [Polypedilum vanderplanki]|uniref:Uncharacterized protein n=1 Tax=Polypedilum vanderplanki TaxID=319348 RepID=A0A9J6CD75_POLVA|nr:hypothetical protein PVAND_009455 [Polypedilum vanderplanki]
MTNYYVLNKPFIINAFYFCPQLVTNISDYEGDLSYMDDDDIDEVTYTNSNQNHKSLTCTSITSISEDRRSISTLNQQEFGEIIKDEDGQFQFKDQIN